MASSSNPSASVTRILTLSNFPSELKTRDIQAAFSEWENERGGFKIKWVDDTTLLLVFADANAAKRCYLSTILSPPLALTSPTGGSTALIKPYDGPDAQTIIQAVNARRNASRASISIPNGGGPGVAHGRSASMASPAGDYGSLGRSSARKINAGGFNNNFAPNGPNGTSNGAAGPMNIINGNSKAGGVPREPSPTLPSLPAHPTLNSLINSSLDQNMSMSPPKDESGGLPPKVGDPAKRMVGAALGFKHPGVPSKGQDLAMKEAQKAMGGITIVE